MRQIDFIWRLFGSGLAFVFFGIGGLCLSLTAFPLITLLVRDPARRADLAQRLARQAFRLHIRFMILFGVINLDVVGAEKLMHDEGTLIVSNHPTLLDVVLLISLLPRTQCIVKAEIWRNPFMRGVVTAAGYIRNDGDPEKLIQDSADVLAAKNNLIIFPEGSRTVPGRPLRLQRGAANIAIRARAPIRLVTIKCVPPTLMKGQKWYEIPPVRMHFTIVVHETIETGRFMSESVPSVAARRLNTYIGERLTELMGVGNE